MKLKISINVAIQVLLTAIQTLSAVSELLPFKWKVIIASVVAILQGVVGLLAHFKTPDGESIPK